MSKCDALTASGNQCKRKSDNKIFNIWRNDGGIHYGKDVGLCNQHHSKWANSDSLPLTGNGFLKYSPTDISVVISESGGSVASKEWLDE